MTGSAPSIDTWLAEAKRSPEAHLCGMYLTHVGVVRATPKARVRDGVSGGVDADASVGSMTFAYDPDKVDSAVAAARAMPGIHHVRVWLNEGELEVGDDVMRVLIGGDIRPHVVDCLQELVGTLKGSCVSEVEHAS